jgi:hypothetical protein
MKKKSVKEWFNDNVIPITVGSAIGLGIIIGGSVVGYRYKDAIELDTLLKKSSPFEGTDAPSLTKLLIDWYKNSDICVDKTCDGNTPITMLAEEVKSIVEFGEKYGRENDNVTAILMFAKKSET